MQKLKSVFLITFFCFFSLVALCKAADIVISVTKTAKELKDVPVATSVVTKKDIEKSNSQTVTDVLSYTPGVNVSQQDDSPGVNSWKISMQGLRLNEGYGLLLIDGQRIKGGGMGEYGYGINQISPEMIERVEVVRGPGSVLYGSDAMAGVINIITKPAPEKRIFSCYTGYGTGETFNAGARYGDKINKFGYLFDFSTEKSEIGKYGREDDYKGNFANSKFGYELNKNKRLNLNLAWTDKSYRYSDEYSLKVSPQWETGFSDGSNLSIKGYWYLWDFHSFTPGYTGTKGDMEYRQAETQYSKLFFSKHLITSGVEYLEEVMDYNLVDKAVNTKSVFLQDEWLTAFKNFDLTVGCRYDSHSRYGEEISPRIAGLYRLNEKTQARASIGRSFKSPTVRQLYYKEPYKHGNYYIRSNPNLDAETGIGYSFGAERIFSEKISLDTNLFRNEISDMVISYDTGETYLGKKLNTYKNVAEAYTQGVELEVRNQLTAEFKNTLSYTFLDTKDKETDKQLTYRPKHTAGWRLNYDNKKYGFGVNCGLKYVSSMFKDTINTQQTDDYFVAEAKLTKEVMRYIKASLEIDNIFVTDYGDPTVDRLGRTFMGKVNMNF